MEPRQNRATSRSPSRPRIKCQGDRAGACFLKHSNTTALGDRRDKVFALFYTQSRERWGLWVFFVRQSCQGDGSLDICALGICLSKRSKDA
jgi:hypothetical protein